MSVACWRRPAVAARPAAALLASAVLLCGAGACVPYAPRPLPAQQLAHDFEARSLEDPGLRAELDARLPARHGDWPRARWDRADLLVAALRFNDGLAESRAAARVAASAVRSARAWPNPAISPLLLEYANQHDSSPLWLYGLATDFLVDVGVKRRARLARAALVARDGEYQLAESLWRTRAALRRALADLLFTRREVTLLEGIAADRADQLAMVRRRLELGAVARGDLDRIVGDAALEQQRLADARRRSSAAQAALAASIGVPAKALAEATLAWDELETPLPPEPQLLVRARDEALLSRSDVLAAVTAYAIAESELRLEVARQYPDVHIGPGYTYDHGVHRLQFNLAFVVPLLNRNRGPIAEAEARREQAGAHLEAVVASASADLDEALRQWELARSRVSEAHGPLYENAARIYAATERSFNSGASDRGELVAARIARALTQLQLLEAERAAQEALGVLEDAARRPFEGPELALEAVTRAAVQP